MKSSILILSLGVAVASALSNEDSWKRTQASVLEDCYGREAMETRAKRLEKSRAKCSWLETPDNNIFGYSPDAVGRAAQTEAEEPIGDIALEVSLSIPSEALVQLLGVMSVNPLRAWAPKGGRNADWTGRRNLYGRKKRSPSEDRSKATLESYVCMMRELGWWESADGTGVDLIRAMEELESYPIRDALLMERTKEMMKSCVLSAGAMSKEHFEGTVDEKYARLKLIDECFAASQIDLCLDFAKGLLQDEAADPNSKLGEAGADYEPDGTDPFELGSELIGSPASSTTAGPIVNRRISRPKTHEGLSQRPKPTLAPKRSDAQAANIGARFRREGREHFALVAAFSLAVLVKAASWTV